MHQVLKNNIVIFESMNENDCYIFILQNQGQSWDYALKYSGYQIRKTTYSRMIINIMATSFKVFLLTLIRLAMRPAVWYAKRRIK